MLSHTESVKFVKSCWVVLSPSAKFVKSCWIMLSPVESCWVMLGPHCGPNASSDLADGLVNSFGRVGASQNNVSGWGRPSVYKKTTSTSDEKRSANTHPSSDLPSYEPYDTGEPLSYRFSASNLNDFDLWKVQNDSLFIKILYNKVIIKLASVVI